MREVSTIKDSDSLRAWLEALPQGTEAERDEARRWAVAIAHRAAMRVLVKVWSISIRSSGSSRPFEAMPSILANIGLNVLFQGREISLEEIVARLEALSLSDQRNGVLPHLAAKIALDAYAADFHTDLFSCVGNAVNAASFHSGGQSSAFWAAVRSDCRAILKRQSFTESPLWESNSSFLASWSELMPRILAQGEGWRFWVDWYDNALHGRPQDYDLLTKIALIEPTDWDKGADHVNALIQRIIEEHKSSARPAPAPPSATTVSAIQAHVPINALTLSLQLAGLVEVAEAEIERLRCNNAIEPEARDALTGALNNLRNAAQQLLNLLPGDGPLSDPTAQEIGTWAEVLNSEAQHWNREAKKFLTGKPADQRVDLSGRVLLASLVAGPLALMGLPSFATVAGGAILLQNKLKDIPKMVSTMRAGPPPP